MTSGKILQTSGWLLSTMLLFSLISCEKPAGLGGKAEIKGIVTVKSYDAQFRVFQASYPAANENVYIIYGDNETNSDDVKTSYNGLFSFPYLSKGNYKIFVYSDDSLTGSPSGKIHIEKKVNLNSNDEKHDLGELVIYKTLDIDDGNARIEGRVLQVNYSKDFYSIIDTTKAQELPVYLRYEDNPEYVERIRTLNDGTFAITNLIKGHYTLLVYSEDTNGGTENISVIRNPHIEGLEQIVNVGDIFIAKD